MRFQKFHQQGIQLVKSHYTHELDGNCYKKLKNPHINHKTTLQLHKHSSAIGTNASNKEDLHFMTSKFIKDFISDSATEGNISILPKMIKSQI